MRLRLGDLVKVLPSECFNVKLELSYWNDYPAFYSFSVARLVLSSYGRNEGNGGLREWILVNSPFYGVVIDVKVRDCVFLLFRVCLRAIVREAIGFVRGLIGVRGRFECRVLGEVMMWLGEQFGVLYGDVNGKMFAINMLKQWLMIGLSGSVFFGGEQRVRESSVGPVKGSEENGAVLVSEVEAAVVALRERAALEARTKAARASRFVPAYQRVQEHQYITKMADEERKKRPDYRPIIEHDGVLWHRGDNQDANKNKSREELLAEERDYKRRRMSYRGKKMKRSTTQVMRDIIDEYMEEIKHANIANQPRVDATNVASEPSSMIDAHSDKDRHDEIEYKSHRKESVSDISRRSEDHIKERSNKHRDDARRQEYYHDDRRRSTSRSRDHGQRDDRKRSRKYYTSSPDRGHSRSRDNRKRSEHRDKRSSSIVSNEFEDRYDPSKS
ncbi:Actin-binding FH2 [Artemisia annua]|uniref:Actin-binding FH2 n=1 Tax=Artemisia annua TaxID=35608 RepID=A0A2U1N3Q4_ARTAN|nr:Actin-binding FH2 [Artemisia annua]